MNAIDKLKMDYWTAREEYIRAEQEFVNYGGLWASQNQTSPFTQWKRRRKHSTKQ